MRRRVHLTQTREGKNSIWVERLAQTCANLLLTLRGDWRSCGCNEFGTSPTVIIQRPILYPNEIWSHKHWLENTVIDEEHESWIIPGTADPHQEIKRVHGDEDNSTANENYEGQRQRDIPLAPIPRVCNRKLPHTIVACTELFFRTVNCTKRINGHPAFQNDQGQGCRHLKWQCLQWKIAVLLELTP